MNTDQIKQVERDMEQAIKDLQHNLDWFKLFRGAGAEDPAKRLGRMSRRVMAHMLNVQGRCEGDL